MREFPACDLMVIGAGDHLETARQLVVQKHLEECVSFTDQVPIDELPHLLAEADVGLVPNRASNATHLMLPVKLLDYTALGIPTIVARLRTVEHYFGERAVRFVEPGNSRRFGGRDRRALPRSGAPGRTGAERAPRGGAHRLAGSARGILPRD